MKRAPGIVSLWILPAAPALWALHFLLSYGTAAVWCAKAPHEGSFAVVRWLIVAYSVVALSGIAGVARAAHRRRRAARPDAPTDGDSVSGRERFLGFAALLLAGLSALAIVYAAVVVAFIGSCR